MSNVSNVSDNLCQAVGTEHGSQNLELITANDDVTYNEDVTARVNQMMCIQRITNLPVILSTLQAASQLYDKIKSFDTITHRLCINAEKMTFTTLNVIEAINSQIPLECPLQAVDSLVCAGLDYIEYIVPGIKLPPNEIYENSRKYICEICNCIRESPRKCIHRIISYTTTALAEILFISACMAEIVRDGVQELSESTTEKQQQLSHAEYQMIIEAIRLSSDCRKQRRRTSLAECSTGSSSPISGLSIEF